jgi:glyoxylase-like metal-dependent hydrolase (beta-lactamase superfamily II)
VRQVAKNVYSIDDQLYSIAGLGSVYLLIEEKIALIDSGPTTSAEAVLQGIREIGVRPEEVSYIVITHIHLDHSGGVGVLLKEMPGARVVVHHKALKHIINPARLISSAVQAQGQEVMVRNGAVLPVEEGRTMAVHDLDVLGLGDEQVLSFREAPGHAPHHLCIYESRNRGVFVGDAVGHQVEGTDIMVPITPPPGFDLELYLKTLEGLGQLEASRIYFAHSGVSDQVQEKLGTAAKKLDERQALIEQFCAENNLGIAAERIVDHICDEIVSLKKNLLPIYNYWASVDIPMSAAEHVRYYRKTHSLQVDSPR